jgi:NAD(P)-dependent dehydrogenase (short-subunit alcohol dehydrogenase family)
MAIDNSENSFKLQDRTALLTGPCNSINQSICSKLTQMGVNVAIVDRNIEKSTRYAAQLMDAREVQERYGRAVAIQADLSKPHHIQDAVARAAESFGGIDIYIDGLMTTEAKSFKEASSLEDLDRVIDVNLRASLMMTHSVLRFLEGRKRGRVIYLMHDIARMGIAQNSLLAATRSGLTAFARSLARETAENNITVNCVAFGLSEEFLLAQSKSDSTSINELQGQLVKSYPFAQMTEPEKVANLVAFLASPLGSAITGQTVAVSNGMSFLS